MTDNFMTASIQLIQGSPTLFIDQTPVFPAVYRSNSPTLNGYESASIAKSFADAGIHLISIDVGTHGNPPEWVSSRRGKGGNFDFSSVKKRFGYILDSDPKAKLLLRINLEMPEWWCREYPEECEVLDDGKPGSQSFASKIWQVQSNAFLQSFVSFLFENGLGDRVFAYQPGGGNTTEWVKPFAMKDRCGDYSKPMINHFRDWLYRKYRGDVIALRESWRDDKVYFESVTIPSRKAQFGDRQEIFRDPILHQPVVDYFSCWNELIADLAIESCRTIKIASGNQALAGVFFGKLFELAWNSAFFGDGHISETSAYQRSGHLYLKRVLESPYVDFITSSYMYSFRGLGGSGAPMLPTESVTLHGKLHLYDDDTRTHLSVHSGLDYGRGKDLSQSIAILKRNFCEAITKNLAVTWLSGSDKYPHFNPQMEPAFDQLLRQMKKIGDFSLCLDRSANAEIAVILDPNSFFYQTMRNDLDIPAIVQQRVWGLPRLGAPFDIYILDDILDGAVRPYKLYIFLNLYAISTPQRDRLKKELEKSGAVALWIFAPGFIASDAKVANMTDLTGFNFNQGDHAWYPKMIITDFNHPITQYLSPDITWGVDQRLKPISYVEDEGARVLGNVILSQGRCVPGFALKRVNHWTSVYCAVPNIPAPVLRGLARFAGVHIYSDQGDVLFAGKNFLGLHSLAAGIRNISLPKSVELIYDLFEDEMIGQDTDCFQVVLQSGSTALYYIGQKSMIQNYWKIAGGPKNG